ncbi:collagen-like protein [Lactiplantibacillus plantarum]|uniref:collagen-like protein n=1 Tax=Lactiplantibacillus plantarum TaxID=1590 RepID=UPI00264D5FB5|nr:collagen-like protein [Lactiplantibacillus plantarum]MDN7065494.1 collagen-like protein [Lactiplantibacillus plantarum]
MAKTLSFTDTSPQTVKIGDTTTSFTLICGNDNVATDLTNATSITAKLGNASGYLKSATVDLASLTDPTTGQVTVNFTADLMTSLPAGSYAIEVWVVDSTGTSIYPSDGSTGFTITNNIQSANGSVITTITFDDFVAAMNKAASTISKGDKGDKGDTGTVDNTGLISAPAFQSLQAQVNNSAVGTNLLLGTSKTLKTVNNAIGWNTGIPQHLANITTINSDTPYTARTRISQASYDMKIQISWKDASGVQHLTSGSTVSAGTSDYSTWTGTITAGSTIQFVTLVFAASQLTASSFSYCETKLERGSHATDWCPNPSEILTQSDYAKIKAAIVALGGSLS